MEVYICMFEYFLYLFIFFREIFRITLADMSRQYLVEAYWHIIRESDPALSMIYGGYSADTLEVKRHNPLVFLALSHSHHRVHRLSLSSMPWRDLRRLWKFRASYIDVVCPTSYLLVVSRDGDFTSFLFLVITLDVRDCTHILCIYGEKWQWRIIEIIIVKFKEFEKEF